jgi:hypothetical protein
MADLTIHPPLQGLRGLKKLSKLRNFHYTKKLNKTPLFRHGHTLTTAGPFCPPATHKVSPFQNIPLFLFIFSAVP